jgi:hypothetical protein
MKVQHISNCIEYTFEHVSVAVDAEDNIEVCVLDTGGITELPLDEAEAFATTILECVAAKRKASSDLLGTDEGAE